MRLFAQFGNARIYYDGECNFCRRGVKFLHRTLFLPRTKVLPGQTDPNVLRLMAACDSWVVVDSTGAMHTEFDAAIALLRASPIFFVFAPIARIPFVSRWGNRFYRYVADHRPRICIPNEPEKNG